MTACHSPEAQASVYGAPVSGVNWGDVPTWLASVFAGGAALFAYQTIKSQREQIGEQRVFIGEQSATLELERAELRAAAEDRRWAQARLVRMDHHKAGGEIDGQGVRTEGDHWDVIVVNGSDAEVHRVEVRFGTAYTASEVFEWLPGWSPESPAQRGDRLTALVDLIGPRRAARFLSQRWQAATVHNNRPTVYFTDNSGVRWSLDSYGKLEEAPAAPGA